MCNILVFKPIINIIHTLSNALNLSAAVQMILDNQCADIIKPKINWSTLISKNYISRAGNLIHLLYKQLNSHAVNMSTGMVSWSMMDNISKHQDSCCKYNKIDPCLNKSIIKAFEELSVQQARSNYNTTSSNPMRSLFEFCSNLVVEQIIKSNLPSKFYGIYTNLERSCIQKISDDLNYLFKDNESLKQNYKVIKPKWKPKIITIILDDLQYFYNEFVAKCKQDLDSDNKLLLQSFIKNRRIWHSYWMIYYIFNKILRFNKQPQLQQSQQFLLIHNVYLHLFLEVHDQLQIKYILHRCKYNLLALFKRNDHTDPTIIHNVKYNEYFHISIESLQQYQYSNGTENESNNDTQQ